MFHTNNGFNLGSRANYESKRRNTKVTVELRLTDKNTTATVNASIDDWKYKRLGGEDNQRRTPNCLFSILFPSMQGKKD